VKHFSLPMAVLFAAVWFAGAFSIMQFAIARFKLFRTNFLGRRVPTGYGLFALLWSPFAFLPFVNCNILKWSEAGPLLVTVVCFGGLGFIDDLFGDRSVGGLKGHFQALLAEHRVTTGLIKAVGGAVCALIAARVFLQSTWPETVLNGAIIALSANTINLLDLRPGRACAFFFVVSAVLIGIRFASSETPAPLWLVVIPALFIYAYDARGLAMMGDTGSNLLGAALGVSFVQPATPLYSRLSVLAVLAALHFLAERISISSVIETNPLLRRIDSWTGKRV
jgi:UDP-GlcNAc:undecaprenyl-phosphate GlcNAc-1-phosphate transferase